MLRSIGNWIDSGSASGNVALVAIVAASQTSYVDTAVTNGAPRYYNIHGVVSGVDSAAASVNATPVAAPQVSAAPGNQQVSLAWAQVASATGYNVFRCASPGAENVATATPINGSTPLSASTTSYTDTGLVNGQAYYYEVVAVNATGKSDPSAEAAATPVNPAPTVATGASATPNPVTAGTTTALSVLGADDRGEANLTYAWSASGPAAVTFSASATNAAKSSAATFTAAGAYTLTCTINDAQGASVSSSASVTVSQALATLTVTPSTATVNVGAAQQFAAGGIDQFGAAMASLTGLAWSVTSGTGAIDPAAGLYTAPATAETDTVHAAVGAVTATASVTVLYPVPAVPTGATATAGFACIRLAWRAPATSSVASYNVYRSTTSGGEGSTPLATGLGDTAFEDDTATIGTTYYYTVSAVNSYGEGSASNEVSSAAAGIASISLAPSEVIGTGYTTATVSLGGGAPSSGADIAVSCSNGSLVPGASVHFKPGDLSATVPLQTINVPTVTTATIWATGSGSSQSTQMTIDPLYVASIALSESEVTGAGDYGLVAATITLNAPTPVDTSIVVGTNDITTAQVVAPVTIPAGASRGYAAVSTSHVASPQDILISAAVPGQAPSGPASPAAAPSALKVDDVDQLPVGHWDAGAITTDCTLTQSCSNYQPPQFTDWTGLDAQWPDILEVHLPAFQDGSRQQSGSMGVVSIFIPADGAPNTQNFTSYFSVEMSAQAWATVDQGLDSDASLVTVKTSADDGLGDLAVQNTNPQRGYGSYYYYSSSHGKTIKQVHVSGSSGKFTDKESPSAQVSTQGIAGQLGRIDCTLWSDATMNVVLTDHGIDISSSVEPTFRKGPALNSQGQQASDQYGNPQFAPYPNLRASDGTMSADIALRDGLDDNPSFTDVTFHGSRSGQWPIDGDSDHWYDSLKGGSLGDTLTLTSPNMSDFGVEFIGDYFPVNGPVQRGDDGKTDHIHLTYTGADGTSATQNYYINTHSPDPVWQPANGPTQRYLEHPALTVESPGYARLGSNVHYTGIYYPAENLSNFLNGVSGVTAVISAPLNGYWAAILAAISVATQNYSAQQIGQGGTFETDFATEFRSTLSTFGQSPTGTHDPNYMGPWKMYPIANIGYEPHSVIGDHWGDNGYQGQEFKTVGVYDGFWEVSGDYVYDGGPEIQ